MKNKRLISLLLSICLIAALFTGFSVSASADGDIISYTVKSGDWLAKICTDHGLNYFQCKNAIMTLNGFTSERQLSVLSIGQVIKLPASDQIAQTVKASTTTTTTTTTTAGSTVITTTSTGTVSGTGTSVKGAAFYLIPHVVKSGETLSSICNAYGTSYAEYADMILSMNGIKSVRSVPANKTIYIPSTTAPNGPCYAVIAHKVSSGETITSISNSYGVSYANNSTLINGLNGKTSMNRILVNQTIYVPAVTTSGAISGGSAASGTSTVSTGTSSASSAAAYEISFSGIDTKIGSPYATVNNVNVSKAAAGSTVVIAGNSSTGYALKSITVTNADGSTKSTYQGNSFIMPGCAVRVECNYIKAWAVVKMPTNNGTFSILVNDAAGNYALKDDKITIVPAPNTGYAVDTVVLYEKDDSTKIKTLTANKDGSYVFDKMLEKEVHVKVTFKDAAYYELTWDTSSGLKNGSISVKAAGYTVSSGTSVGEGTTVVVTAAPNQGYAASFSTTPAAAGAKQNGNTYTFKMPPNAVKINVQFYNNNVYSISSNSNTGGGSLVFMVNGNVQNVAIAGQEVTIVPKSNGAYEFSDAFVRFADLSATVPMSTAYTFTMPSANVVVYGQFVEKGADIKHIVSQSSESDCNFTVKDSLLATGNMRTKFSNGEKVYIAPGYDHEKYAPYLIQYRTIGGTWANATDEGTGWYSFTMPNEDVEIKAVLNTFEKWVEIKLEDYAPDGIVLVKLNATANGAKIESGTQVKNGTVISITATVFEGITFEGFTEDGVNDLVSTGTYSCNYTVAWNDNSTVTINSIASK